MSDMRIVYELDTLEKMKEQGISPDVDFEAYLKADRSSNCTHKLVCTCGNRNGFGGMIVRYQDYFDILGVDGFDSPVYYKLDLDNPEEIEYARQIQNVLDDVLSNDFKNYREIIIQPAGLPIEEYMYRMDLFNELQRKVDEELQFRGFRTISN